jgi:hypothetical protein
MKIIISILALINGAYMFIDGIHVVLKHKFIGPEKPGPWANLFYKLNIDVFKLGPLFIAFGLIWFAFLYGIWANQPWAQILGIIISVATLWYLPIGTFFSMVILGILIFTKWV